MLWARYKNRLIENSSYELALRTVDLCDYVQSQSNQLPRQLRFIWHLIICSLAIIILLTSPVFADNQDSAPMLKIGGAESRAIKLTRNNADFQYKFQIESTNTVPVQDLRISVTPFIDPNSAQVETNWIVNGQPGDTSLVSVAGLGSVNVEIKANLPIVGPYASTITLVYANKRESISLTVTRTRIAATVEVLGLETARADSGLTNEVALFFTLHETAGQNIRLNPPSLTALSLSEANKGKIQAIYDTPTVRAEDNTAISGSFELKGGESKRLKLIIPGLKVAGEYTGTMRVTAPDTQPLDQPITILIRKSGWYALILIFLGVLLSHLIRKYAKSTRPRIINQRRILALLSDIDGFEMETTNLSKDERGILNKLRRRSNDLYEYTEIDADKNTDVVLDEIDHKLSLFPKWVNGRKRVETIQPPELRVEFQRTLKQAELLLLGEGTQIEDINHIAGQMEQLELRITDTVRQHLLAELERLEQEVEEWIKGGRSSALIEALSRDVINNIKKASELANQGSLPEARAVFDEARSNYARLLAVDLSAQIRAAPKPFGFDQQAWDELKSRVTKELAVARDAANPDTAISTYQLAYSVYLRELAITLQEQTEQYLRVIPNIGALDDKKKEHYSDRLSSVIKSLDEAMLKLNEKHLRQANGEYAKANAEFNSVVNELDASGIQLGATTGEQTAAAPAAGGIPGMIGEKRITAIAAREQHQRPTVEDLTKKMNTYDNYLSLVVLAIAVVLGLRILWAESLTWGSFNDCLAAFLWGLGLHQVSGVAFEGTTSLTEKLTK